ncbi:MAG: GHMP kinase [Dehalococcoidia bacterium]|nr:GHMP kinase [Dehalococcoidia bacterium]
MIVRAKAPLRISFAGGGTDVDPYPQERGGCVLSCTIDRYSYCTITSGAHSAINVKSLDYDIITSFGVGGEFHSNGKLDLVRASLKVVGVRQGMDVFLHSDVPPAAGLGASSSVTVALVGALTRWKELRLTDYDIAELAYRIEREEVGIRGGRQDQYAATFGGFNFIEFGGDETVVAPLNIKQDTLNELQYRLMLCYTGKRRLSAGIIEDQVNRYLQKREEVVLALDKTKQLAIEIRNALLMGKIDEIGSLLHQGWLAKKKFSSRMTDPHIDELYETATKNGALGGKLLGAGGGGYFLFLCHFDKWHRVAQELERCGGKVTSFAFDFHGLQTWDVNNNSKMA